jgi:hypothetical protein
MPEPLDTAEYRRWYGLDKPWTGGSDVYWHLGQALNALDEARAKYDEIGDEVRELDVQIWIGKWNEERTRADAAEARIARTLAECELNPGDVMIGKARIRRSLIEVPDA